MNMDMQQMSEQSFFELIRDAAQWHLAALLLLPPSASRKCEIQSLLREIQDPALFRIAENWCSDPTTEEYFRIVYPGGQVSLRAVSYLPLVSPGEMLATLEELYDRMGYRNSTEEPPDHLAVLADCYAFLSLRAAYMVANQRQNEFLSFIHLHDDLAVHYLLPVLSSLVEKLQNHQTSSLRATVEWMRDVLHPSACHNLSPPSQLSD